MIFHQRTPFGGRNETLALHDTKRVLFILKTLQLFIKLTFVHNNRRLNEAFGILQFDGTEKYYALDGQHRLAAIKTLLDRNNPLSDGAPKNFEDR